MTLGEERDIEKIKECLTYVQADKHSERPPLGCSLSMEGRSRDTAGQPMWSRGNFPEH